MVLMDYQAMSDDKIKDFHNLLQKHLDPNQKILKTEVRNLTASGENFGSLMLSLRITLRNKTTGKDELLQLVAKTCPPNEWLKAVFDTPTSFKKEIEFYNTILPMMDKFKPGVTEIFPKCFGARASLDSNTIDDDAVILLKNLKISGYEVMDRMRGFDLEIAEMVLKDLAVFHAVPIAIKLQNPDIFNKNILAHLTRNTIFDTVTPEIERGITESVLKVIATKPECVPFLENIEKSLKSCLINIKNDAKPREPFATINHNDLWVNNVMVQTKSGKTVKSKIVDFQLIDYGSPGNDIVFFLFTSVQPGVVKVHYDHLIKLYYDKFVEALKGLNCDTSAFTFERLLEEIKMAAQTRQCFRVITMLRVILGNREAAKDISEFTEEDAVSDGRLSDEYRQRIPEVAFEFVKRKWIHC